MSEGYVDKCHNCGKPLYITPSHIGHGPYWCNKRACNVAFNRQFRNKTMIPTPIDEAFQAQVIEDSISPYGIRLTTFQLRYPRFIHSEFMTHRQFSRNARSSRAVPVKRLLTEPPYIPTFLRNAKGMQGFDPLDEVALDDAINHWLDAANECKEVAEVLGEEIEVHKQWANRMLEWFGYIDVVVSSTYWKNFFNLRDHPAAMPEIQHLARAMLAAKDASTPRECYFGDWHLPYIQVPEYGLPIETKYLLSTARCARVSYKPFDADAADTEKDIALARKLILEDPLHASPAEHQATPDQLFHNGWDYSEQHGNFCGWRQHRKMYPNEVVNEDYSFETLLKYFQKHDGAGDA